MVDQNFYYHSAYLFAAPISALITGAALDRAYCSRHVALKFRWGSNAVAFLSLAFIAIILRENYAGMRPRGDDALKTLDRPTVAHVLTPLNIGCVEFLIQAYYIQQLFKTFGKTVWTIVSLVICGISFMASWAGTISILLKVIKPPQELIDLASTGLPTFQLDSPALAAWLATSLLSELVIVGGNLYARRSKHFSDEEKPIRFLRYDHILTKIAVTTLQTSALSALLIMTASLIFFVNALTGDTPTPGTTGCFVLLNLMRVPVGYASLVFSLVRERNLSINAIRKSLMMTSNSSLNDSSVEEGKRIHSANQVTVHTVTSRIFER